MSEAVVCIGTALLIEDLPAISYTVAVMGLPTYSYASNYIVNTSISPSANLAALRNKVISQAAEHGVKLKEPNIIVFGAPS